MSEDLGGKCVKKYIKAVLFIIAYTLIYMSLMLICQFAFGILIGGAGRELPGLFSQGATMTPERLEEAAIAMANQINDYVLRNTGIIFSISALLALLIFIRIFSARKINLFSEIHMDRRPSGMDIRYGAFAGASANFLISMIVVALQSVGLFTEAFSEYDSHIEMTFGQGGLFPTFLGLGIIVPIFEEIMFRGMITFEIKRIAPWKAAIIAQGVIFGLYHLVPVQICYTTPLGIYFGYIAYKSDTIWPAAAGHIAMNTVAIMLSAPIVEPFLNQPTFSLLFAIISVYMFVSSMMYFVKKKPPIIL